MGYLSQYSDCATGWTAWVQLLAEAMKRFLSLNHCVHTGSEAHSASYPVIQGILPWGKTAGAWSWPLTSI